LPIATGFYLFAGFFNPQVFLISIPISLTIFNVILMNEFPDEETDRAIGKRNLVVRLGKERAGDLYMGFSILAAFTFLKVVLVSGPSPFWLLILSGIPILLILGNLIRFMNGSYQNALKLEHLCRNTLLVNLSMGMTLTLQQILI
jgi:1,4-dihydroxy-2-naphthoate octaprenyltransferase